MIFVTDIPEEAPQPPGWEKKDEERITYAFTK
jgi:hypothetical protein